jgi:hypothetical protein
MLLLFKVQMVLKKILKQKDKASFLRQMVFVSNYRKHEFVLMITLYLHNLKILKYCSKMDNIPGKNDWIWVYEKLLTYCFLRFKFLILNVNYARKRISKKSLFFPKLERQFIVVAGALIGNQNFTLFPREYAFQNLKKYFWRW